MELVRHLEGILEQARAGGDLERAAVMRGPPDHDQGGASLPPVGADAHLGKAVLKKLAKPFGPIGEDARALLELLVHAVDDRAIGPRPADARK